MVVCILTARDSDHTRPTRTKLLHGSLHPLGRANHFKLSVSAIAVSRSCFHGDPIANDIRIWAVPPGVLPPKRAQLFAQFSHGLLFFKRIMSALVDMRC